MNDDSGDEFGAFEDAASQPEREEDKDENVFAHGCESVRI